jgi:outer membrane lipoprotein-sorting protein
MFISSNLCAKDFHAYDIMKKADERYKGDSAQYSITMTLINKKGNRRIRELIYFYKKEARGEKSVMIFKTPKDIAQSGYLVWSYDDDKDDDAWLYLPAMKKTRRISGSGKSDDFMGTEFAYEDIGKRNLSKDNFTLKDDAIINEYPCWTIEAKAKDAKERYPRRTLKIRKDCFIIAEADYYDRQETLVKQLSVTKIKEIDGIFTAEKMEMKNLQSGRATIIETADMRFNVLIDDDIFTAAALERGTIK